MAKRGWRSANLSPDRRVFFGQGRGDVRSRALAARVTASFGSRGGASTADLLFPLLFNPTLISVTPDSGIAAGGTVVDLAGMDFQPGATVTFGGTPAMVFSVTPTHIIATTPAHAVGAVDVTVSNPSGTPSTLVNGYTFTDPLFVAVAAGGTTAATSADGITWTARVIPASNYKGIAWSGSIFAAVGDAPVAASSPDGITWTSRVMPSNCDEVVWAQELGLFVTVSQLKAVNTSPDGITWTARGNLPGFAVGFGIAWDGSKLSTGGFGNASFEQGATSANALAWTDNFMPPPNGTQYTNIVWTGSEFVAVATSPAGAAVSVDGVNWTRKTTPSSNGWFGVAWNGSVLVAVGLGSIGVNNKVITSSDHGETWTARALPSEPGGGLFCIAWNGSLFAAAGQIGTKVYTSPDGFTWTERVMPTGNYQAMVGKSI